MTSANEELQKLARFIEVNQAFKFSLTPDDVLCLIVDAAIEITQAERGFLMLRNCARRPGIQGRARSTIEAGSRAPTSP